ncbi:LEVG family PEP-CTERM protein [Roseofilum sp. BLCC_M91]|uniref:LEVG family PEP-CTERM protein n=1 Tax=Roseofilum halophilum BLCC-M91 TaxID=3022259 RepID=A0ABT7BIK9_9CYAN|nr:LEVG family PEP-CTERM protein [Roseofilum halophilum]MDJ1179028.1 LEVG family PEP-CTERM protein [Roseofilum halophilum BLCC-M91]
MVNHFSQFTISATTATLAVTLLGSSAFAGTLVPQEEGELDVGFGCLETCIALPDLISSIESLTDSTTGAKSRLFVDDVTGSANTYTDGTDTVSFASVDAGTNSSGFWYRPVDTDEENGQLEVGTFKFTFTKMLSELIVGFFDTERSGETGVVSINDVAVDDYLAKGPNSNVQSKSFYDVSSITLKLGYDDWTLINGKENTGDGVNFRLATAVPEPASVLGLGAVAVLGALGLRKRSA